MKKLMMCVVMLVLGFVLILGTANETKAASAEVVKMDGAQVVNGRTLVPLRSVFEELGANVIWNQQQKTVTITHGAKKIMLKIDSNQVNVNGQPQTIDVAPTIIGGRTYVPLRFISETIGAVVKWEPASKTAIVVYNGKEIHIKTYRSFLRDTSKTYTFSHYEGISVLDFFETKNNRDYWNTTFTYDETTVGTIYYRETANGLYMGTKWNDGKYSESVELKYPITVGSSWVNYNPEGYGYSRSTITSTNKTFRMLGETYANTVEVKVVSSTGYSYLAYLMPGAGLVGVLNVNGECGEQCTVLREIK
ncbi:copper amine oxidase N-terminal domain-containing protein [Alkalihalophilus marmarensis]|uniref:Copper amine oxidase-like N-terminal domain-containing protein n=1 Tax=Alkalihalophilus marmarensis DSM 21297 TaxID=1188261 RepID=U6SLR7_9BACI|nr:copper amine oxidase N-terminal domain-containing protein [Alkalihalophilus marmarensis]ERN51830.1 hypothetical protein A33I_18640 [Alkalihalophilus marmarensis DSM 21297]